MQIRTFYLEMFAHAQKVVPPPRPGLAVVHERTPSVAFYRSIYDAVGGNFNWVSRKKLSDAELAAIIQHPLDEVHVLTVEGQPAGFAELDRRKPDDIELVQFGLAGPYIGQGLGKYFLQWTIDKAWSYRPRRFWLHTCTRDHPHALPNYLKAGFVVYKEEVKESD